MIHHIEEERINQEIVINSNKLMILDIFAEWCIPCQMLAPILAEIDKKYHDVEIYKVNADEAPNFVTLHDISSIPTLIFFKDGEEKERVVGLESIENLESIIDNYLGN